MLTDTADASNSKQKLQHWINKNQINKNKTNRHIHFLGKSQYNKRGRKTHFRHNRGKILNTGKYVREG